MIERLHIQNFKSIKDLWLDLKPVNVLIGSNGVGKSNFISFFELTKAIYSQDLGAYTGFRDMSRLLYNGRKHSPSIDGLLDFNNVNAFRFSVIPTMERKGMIALAGDYFNNHGTQDKNYAQNWNWKQWDNMVSECSIKTQDKWRAGYLKKYLESFTVYHFHDTSISSPMRGFCNINDNVRLRENGSNLAACLYHLSLTDAAAFRLIEGTVRAVAPYFKEFTLAPLSNDPSSIYLTWRESGTDDFRDSQHLSDGTIRFMALATLLLQTNAPEIIILDEPELGLHPAAIERLAAMVKRAERQGRQIIISTQSTNLVNCFDAEDIITVDRMDGETVFNRLDGNELKEWLDGYNYSISDLWEKNVIGGQL